MRKTSKITNMPPIIRQITSLKKLGVFHDHSATAETPQFRRYNLIYGFNGSGKTTLSRVFASLGSGTIDEELPQGGSFGIELSDGTRINNGSSLNALKDRVLVFNSDFIGNNFRWKDGTANPIFYLGKEQGDLAAQLDAISAKIAALSPKVSEAERTHAQADKAFVDHKRSAARLIAEQLGLGRRYDATNLVADYANGSYDAQCAIDESRREDLRAVIAQQAPLPKKSLLSVDPIDLAVELQKARSLLGLTVGAVAVSELREHEAMLRWVSDGVEYHQEHTLSTCLFCGNDLTDQRLATLKEVIDGGFNSLVRNVDAETGRIKSLQERLVALKEAIPSQNDIAKDHQQTFASNANGLRTRIAEGDRMLATTLSLLNQKAKTPNIRIDVAAIATVADANEWDTSFSNLLKGANTAIEAHNISHDEFNAVQSNARDTLKKYFLYDGSSKYHELETAAADARQKKDTLSDELRELATAANSLRERVRQHGPAADVITRMLHCYLGHRELDISARTEGYEVRRGGLPLRGSLSEGEKTAISLCYFLSTIQAEGRKLKDMIVVVDDPISSLDTKALHYAFSVVRSALAGAAQLILMTHNLQFMNEAKKWLRSKTEKEVGAEKATASMFFVVATQKRGSETRTASIGEMPKHVRDYESEYQYLFSLVRDFAASEDGQTGYFYIMPNALRKVLEIFLAFKLPGPDGLTSKIENIVGGEHGLDPARVQALDRLVQLESHADNLDDLIGFSSMTVEETRDAAVALLELMRVLDEPHYKKLCKVCR